MARAIVSDSPKEDAALHPTAVVPRLAAAIFVALIAMAALRAWTCDDALITFRVAAQFLGGDGPVFNVGDRVQVFTHPLWFMFVTGLAALGMPLFPGAMWVSVAIFAAGALALFAAFRDKPLALVAVGTMLFFSRAAMDFATGGLETPLTFALFAAAVHAIRSASPRAALLWLALLPLNRLDLMPWALPLVFLLMPGGLRARLATLATFAAPAFLWMAFSTVYFGDPLPNTAHAKLAAGIAERIGPGLGYVVASFASDPGSLALLAIALVLTLLRLRAPWQEPDARLALALAASAAFGIAYPVWSGGDFMLGRFVLPAIWACAVLVLALFPVHGVARRMLAACLATVGALLALHGETTLMLRLDIAPEAPYRTWEAVGALDERREYLPWYGAFAGREPEPLAAYPERPPLVVDALGRAGYFGERHLWVLDNFALADPLLARVRPLAHSRPGHGYRAYPREFWRWREEKHGFGDARVDALAADLRLAHRSPDLWSAERWRAIARLASAPPLEPAPIAISDQGARLRIEVDPAAMLRHWQGASTYYAWLRQYEERDLGPGVRLPVAIGADCKPYAIPGAITDLPAIEVKAGLKLVLDCDRAILGATPIVMRIGAVGSDGVIHYDAPIPLVRAPFWWLGAVPRWLTHGWVERRAREAGRS